MSTVNRDGTNLIVNLSMLGPSPTGLGIYSEHSANTLEKALQSTVISSYYRADSTTGHIKSSPTIAIGSGRGAAFRRLAYSLLWRNRPGTVVYTPTHHGFLWQHNQIITIHDLIPIHHPAQHKFQYLYFKYILPIVLKRCRAVFTVSQDAKEGIVSYYGLHPSNVHVVSCGIDTSLFKQPTDTGAPDNYLLVVGASYPHKNIEELLGNWRLWKGQYTLKIVGCRGAYRQLLEKIIADHALSEHVEFLGYVPAEELVTLYQHCAAVVFPSLWEGFGMPPLEAMACGRPAIVSDIPVHREVMRSSALYITPGNPDSWSEAFKLLTDSETVTEKLAAGKEIIAKYTWKASGEGLLRALFAVFPELKSRAFSD